MPNKKVDYTAQAVLELMRANIQLYGVAYGNQIKRIPIKVFEILNPEYHDLFRIGSKNKSWTTLYSAFTNKRIRGAEDCSSPRAFAKKYASLISMPQEEYDQKIQLGLKKLSEATLKDSITLKDVFKLVAYTIIDNRADNPNLNFKDFLENSLNKRVKWPKNKKGSKYPYTWQQIIDKAQVGEIIGLTTNFDLAVFVQKITERLYPSDNAEKILNCPTPEEAQKWMEANSPKAKVT